MSAVAFLIFQLGAIFCPGAALCGSDSYQADPKNWPDDGFPLLMAKDAEPLETIWKALDPEGDREKPDDFLGEAVDFQIRRQGAQYKGKLLDVRGRLLRAVEKKTPDGTAFYDVWVLLPDSKRDPVRVLAKNAPEGFQPDAKLETAREDIPTVHYRNERFRATAEYYRTTAYGAEDDLRAAPTFVAYSFEAIQPRQSAGSGKTGGVPGEGWKWLALLAIIPAWFMTRRKLRRNGFPTKTSAILAGALALSLSANFAHAQEDDAKFWSTVAGVSAEVWEKETGENRPVIDAEDPESPDRRSVALALLGTTRRLLTTDALLERACERDRGMNLLERFREGNEPGAAPAGRVFCLSGRIAELREIPLNEAEKERNGLETVWRAEIVDDAGARLAVCSPELPLFTAPGAFFDRTLESQGAEGAKVSGIAILFGSEGNPGVPAALAPRIRWNPAEAPLGRLGVDLSAFESVPVFPADALATEKNPKIRREMARAMRWTADDRDAFYQSLAATADKAYRPRAELDGDVVPLFNSPERSQGKFIRLRGWARRVSMILTSDPETKAATGIDRYYQISFFTGESQGRPIMLCAKELPDGLTPGGGKEYRREIEISGFFFKTWAYRDSEKGDAEEEGEDERAESDLVGNKGRWTRAPVLIGRVERAEPEEKKETAPWSPGTVFSTFAVLAVLWIALRRFAGRRSARILRNRRDRA